MFSGRLLSFVALISLGAGVGCAGVSQKPARRRTAVLRHRRHRARRRHRCAPGHRRHHVDHRRCAATARWTRASSATTATRRRATAAAPSARSPRAGAARARPASARWPASAATASSARARRATTATRTAATAAPPTARRVEPGYECRVPGRRCVPACGDGRMIGGGAVRRRQHDRTATAARRSARSSRAPLHGHAQRLQRRDLRQRHEGRQRGLRLRRQHHRPWPTGCKGPNGLFFGDASGCSKTCTKEPTCRTGAHHAGLRHQLRQRQRRDGRGLRRRQPGRRRRLLADLHARGAASCARRSAGTTRRRARSRQRRGECLQLPIIYRDFKNEKETGGHPDFFYLGATGREPGQHHRRAGPGRRDQLQQALLRSQLERSGQEERLDQPLLGPRAGEPGRERQARRSTWRAPAAPNCDCQFIDWSHDTNGGHVPGYAMAQSPTDRPDRTPTAPAGTRCTAARRRSSPARRQLRPVVGRQHVHRRHARRSASLEMKPIGGGQYQFSSQVERGHGRLLPARSAGPRFPLYTAAPAGPGAPRRWSGPRRCSATCGRTGHSTTAFGAGNNCRGDQYLFPPSLIPPDTTATARRHELQRQVVRRPAGLVPRLLVHRRGALPVHTTTGAFSLQFYGDDDMFIFINGILVVDLGGVHQRLPGRVERRRRDRHGDDHRGRLAGRGRHDHPAVPPARIRTRA